MRGRILVGLETFFSVLGAGKLGAAWSRQLRPLALWCIMPVLERGPGALAISCLVAAAC